jgi:hypothetical protein
VHLPYVETVPAVPTGCFVARSKLRYLTLPTADGRLIDLGTLCSNAPKPLSPLLRRGRFRSTVVERSPLGRRLGRQLADHLAAVHRLKAIRSLIHRFRLKRHLPGQHPHTA